MFKIKYKKVNELRIYSNQFYSVMSKDGTTYYLNGKFHREDGPAIDLNNGNKEWFIDGMRHREDGPAVLQKEFEEWWHFGVIHRDDGPARIDHGRKEWFIDGHLHREDGPAIINVNGKEEWWTHGKKNQPIDFYEFTT